MLVPSCHLLELGIGHLLINGVDVLVVSHSGFVVIVIEALEC